MQSPEFRPDPALLARKRRATRFGMALLPAIFPLLIGATTWTSIGTASTIGGMLMSWIFALLIFSGQYQKDLHDLDVAAQSTYRLEPTVLRIVDPNGERAVRLDQVTQVSVARTMGTPSDVVLFQKGVKTVVPALADLSRFVGELERRVDRSCFSQKHRWQSS